MGIEKKTVSVRLDEDLIAKIRALAEKENRSFSNLVETVLKKYADQQTSQK